MAAIIDGVTNSGYWKLTPDDGTPTSYYVFPKTSIYLDSIGRIRLIYDPAGNTIDVAVDATTKDHTGTALGSIDAIANYLELYR